jgi:hypothetical protein
MKVAKRKTDTAGVWQVVIDGKPSTLVIAKGDPPKYRHPQLWDVIDGADGEQVWLFDASSLDRAVRIIERVLEAGAQ